MGNRITAPFLSYEGPWTKISDVLDVIILFFWLDLREDFHTKIRLLHRLRHSHCAIMLLSHAAAKLAASSAAKSTTVARCGFHSSSALEARKFFVGGNWKCNGSVQQVNDLISMLNQSTLSTDTEVVVCPSQLFVQGVKNGLRGDVAVGSQDVWTGGNGAYTGETSADMLAGKLFLSNLLSN